MTSSGSDLLARLQTTYASAGAYSDRGTAIIVGHEEAPLSGVFTTTFCRGLYLLYEFVPEVGEPVKLRMRTGDPVELVGVGIHVSSLASAIASVTGITLLSAYIVPHLLLPDETRGWELWASESDRVLYTSRVVDGVACMTITFGATTELLIRERDACLLKFSRALVGRADNARDSPESDGVRVFEQAGITKMCVISYEPCFPERALPGLLGEPEPG